MQTFELKRFVYYDCMMVVRKYERYKLKSSTIPISSTVRILVYMEGLPHPESAMLLVLFESGAGA